MSDANHDAERPPNKPKGFGWWPGQRQVAYLQKIWERGDRDEWLVMEMLKRHQITPVEADTILRESSK